MGIIIVDSVLTEPSIYPTGLVAYLNSKMDNEKPPVIVDHVKKAEPPRFKAARLSVEIRSFPSLSSGRFGFVLSLMKLLYVSQLYDKT